MIQQNVYEPDAAFGDYHPFKKFKIYIFVADAFTYDNERYLEDVFCFYG